MVERGGGGRRVPVSGGVGGWSLRSFNASPTEGIAAIAQEFTENFAVYGSDKIHPVEVRAADRAELVEWAHNVWVVRSVCPTSPRPVSLHGGPHRRHCAWSGRDVHV